jgi:hypothetical protein
MLAVASIGAFGAAVNFLDLLAIFVVAQPTDQIVLDDSIDRVDPARLFKRRRAFPTRS